MKTKALPLVLFLLLTVSLSAASIGELQTGGTAFYAGAAPLTVVNLARPATGIGVVNFATFVWRGGPASGCSNALEIKFMRPGEGNFNVYAERGPFDVIAGVNNVSFTSPVAIAPGDVIAFTQLQPGEICGGVANRFSFNDPVATMDGDPAIASVSNSEFAFDTGNVPSIRASTEAQAVHGFLPVVGSTAGSFGSVFRTGVQLTNRIDSTISGRLIFHPAGATGGNGDPFVAYTLAPGQTVNIPDVVAATGATGIGSMDLVTTTGYPPDVAARVFDDDGANGTSGFTEEVMTAHQALRVPHRSTIIVPADMTNFRLNIGVRTLEEGATVNIFLEDSSGMLVAATSRSYAANWFEQLTAGQFIGTEPAPNSRIRVQVTAGSAFVYGAVTDNRTNDPSLRFAASY